MSGIASAALILSLALVVLPGSPRCRLTPDDTGRRVLLVGARRVAWGVGCVAVGVAALLPLPTVVADDRLGRPRSDADVGPRLELLADVVTHPTLASAPVVAAVAHGELLTLRPFGCADGVVARAVSRLVTIATGLDPHGLGVPEVIWMRQPAEYHDAARRFAGGTPDGVAGWLLLCCGAMLDGAREALSIAESLSPG